MKKKPHNIKQKDWDSVESKPLTDDLLEKMEAVEQKHPEIPKKVRGPQKDPKKIPVSIRLNPEILDYFKSEGRGWQSEINNILNDYVKSH